jgi:hypothetical protein
LFSLFPCKPAIAQQPDAPSATNPGPAPQIDTTDLPDPAAADANVQTMTPHFKDTRFWLSGQANFIFQTHPPFYSAYSGPHSLGANYEKATSRVLTLYSGVRLNNTTEVLVDIEEAGGAALSQGFGLAGNTDLDIVRNPLLSKAPYLGRAMIHKVIALSKDKIENERSFLSLFDELPRRRLELRFGKFTMPDFFDVNSVGSDTHLQFINWTADNNGAWDYAADTRGYTVGATADYEDRNWGFRLQKPSCPRSRTESIWCIGRGKCTPKISNTNCVMVYSPKKLVSFAFWPTPTMPTWASTAMQSLSLKIVPPQRRNWSRK